MKSRYHLLFSRSWLFLCMLLMLIPIGVIASALGEFDAEIWEFLLEYQLPVLVKNTLLLVIGVGVGVTLLGVTTAWLTAMYEFKGRKLFFWAMMLPLAVPAYVLAFVQLGIFDYTGFISTYLRESYGFENGLPDVRNGFGLTVVMSLTFYPYVYLLARNAFSSMGGRALEVGASLGLSPMQSFFKLALPIARPWIAGGVVLALMEVLADFGTVSVFGYETFTTAIYEAWFGFYSLESAKQLAMILIVFVFVFIVLEQLSRGKRRFEQTGRASNYQRKPLTGLMKWFAPAYCLIILSVAFLIPIIQLGIWAYQSWDFEALSALWTQTWHAFVISLLAGGLVTLVALGISLAKRVDKSKFAVVATRTATLGYAIPGTVLAVGVFVPVAWFDNVIIDYFQLSEQTTAILKGTLFVMLLAYLLRFLALGVSAVEAGMERISHNLIEASHSLGVTGFNVVKRIYMPLLKGSLGTAMLMTFVDVMKEMPITLMTRPHDWDTLAVRIYAFTTEGVFDKAALPALVIVFVGLIPVMLFSRTGRVS